MKPALNRADKQADQPKAGNAAEHAEHDQQERNLRCAGNHQRADHVVCG
jgi:hypothetical protein